MKNQPIGSTVSGVPFLEVENTAHDFTDGKTVSDKTEYTYIYCKKCGIVSYDQRFKSRSYESKYIPQKCMISLALQSKGDGI